MFSVSRTDASRENEVEKLLGHFQGVIEIPIESFASRKALKSAKMKRSAENYNEASKNFP